MTQKNQHLDKITNRYYGYMYAVKNGKQNGRTLCREYCISDVTAKALRELGFMTEKNKWVKAKGITSEDVNNVIAYNREYHREQRKRLRKSKKPIQIPNIQTVIQPVQTKSHRKDISILWGLISIKIS